MVKRNKSMCQCSGLLRKNVGTGCSKTSFGSTSYSAETDQGCKGYVTGKLFTWEGTILQKNEKTRLCNAKRWPTQTSLITPFISFPSTGTRKSSGDAGSFRTFCSKLPSDLYSRRVRTSSRPSPYPQSWMSKITTWKSKSIQMSSLPLDRLLKLSSPFRPCFWMLNPRERMYMV